MIVRFYLLKTYKVDANLYASDNVFWGNEPLSKMLTSESKKKIRNDPKLVMPKSHDLSRSIEIMKYIILFWILQNVIMKICTLLPHVLYEIDIFLRVLSIQLIIHYLIHINHNICLLLIYSLSNIHL